MSENTGIKHINNKEFKFYYMIGLISITLLLLILGILFFASKQVFLNASDSIKPTIKDMANFNNIYITCV